MSVKLKHMLLYFVLGCLAPCITFSFAHSHCAVEFTCLLLRCDSITVSSTWELTSLSMRYSHGEGVHTSLSRITYCTHVLVYCSVSFLSCMCVVIFRGTTCANKDANNKDDVCKPNIPAGLNRPPPSKTISLTTWFGTISRRLAGILLDLQARDPVRQCIFI